MDVPELKKHFERIYGSAADGAVRAPGRVNLIGEHTDYNDGFVLPIAIERRTVAVYGRRPDRTASFTSLEAAQPASVDLDGQIAPGEPAWGNYCKGVAAELLAFGGGEMVRGCNVLLDSDVPLGGGLSSSASLEVATATALLAAAGRLGAVPARELALICQRAENDYAGAPCGIMDQSIAIVGRAGCALLLDCRSGETRQIPFDDPDAVLLVADTQVKHDIGDGGYPARRAQCMAACDKLGVRALRDVDEAGLRQAEDSGALTELELRRVRHVVGEIGRTLQGVEALEAGDYARFGELMYGSHASMRDDYQISCDEMDEIIELARRCEGVYGARLTGGGFGGCAIVLAKADRAEAISTTIRDGFGKRFGRACPIFATRAAAGASVIES